MRTNVGDKPRLCLNGSEKQQFHGDRNRLVIICWKRAWRCCFRTKHLRFKLPSRQIAYAFSHERHVMIAEVSTQLCSLVRSLPGQWQSCWQLWVPTMWFSAFRSKTFSVLRINSGIAFTGLYQAIPLRLDLHKTRPQALAQIYGWIKRYML